MNFHNNHEPHDTLSRRDFLKAGALGAGAVTLSLAELSLASARRDVNCIFLFLVGGPSQLDTWDLKPNAPSNVRGPFRPIHTNVPGVEICEHFPLMAKMADRYAILRSVHHNEAPIHETGHQLMQTGRLFRGGQEYPHYGAVLSHLRGARKEGASPFVVLPTPIGNTGVSVSHGQVAGTLGAKHAPLVTELDPNQMAAEKPALHEQYGRSVFGESCLLARRLIEQGTRLVTVNMFDTVFNQVTWDCHADGGSLAGTLDDYRTSLCPMFDRAYSALLADLESRGMLDTTLVVAAGEFGRTPQLNSRGGRDHWPGVWSVLFAGAGVQGGQVIGSSDKLGAEPKDRPITPAQIAASVYRALGVDTASRIPGHDGGTLPLVEAEPVVGLFR